MPGQSGTVAASPFHPDPPDPTPRFHRGDQLRVAAGISSELGGSQEATCGIDHRPYMGIPMGVHPADHNRPVDSILVCHVPTLSLAAYNSRSPEPGPAADRTLKAQKSKLLLGHPAPRFRSPSGGQVDRS